MKDSNCIFCKIAGGEIPSATLYEDADFRVIMDISPASKGHALILPKEHYANLYELPDELAAKVLVLAKNMITKLKENIIIYGSTGTGKTEILKRIASIYKVPIVIEDATSLSETGFVGRNITDMLEDLYLAAGKDIEKAQKGILVIDEFDKLAEKSNSHHDRVSRNGVQRSLLKLLDGSTFYLMIRNLIPQGCL